MERTENIKARFGPDAVKAVTALEQLARKTVRA